MPTIIFQNEHFVAVDKPSGWLSVPARMGTEDKRPVVGIELQKTFKKIYPVHRLDFEVSGVILYALEAKAHKDSQKWFEEKSVQKIYHALTENPQNKQLSPHQNFLWTSKILRGKKRAYDHELGKEALTEAQFLELTGSQLKWELKPLTGRSHQLRYEMTKQGFPILGDTLYGSQTAYTPGIALRAVELYFPQEIQSQWNLPNQIKVPSL